MEDCDNPINVLENVTEIDSQFLFHDIDEEFVKKKKTSMYWEWNILWDRWQSPKLMKLAVNLIKTTYRIICFLKTGQMRIDFKTTKIVHIHESGNKLQTGNYMPISIPSVVSKILENAVHSQYIV